MYSNSRMRREIGQYLVGMKEEGMSERYVQAAKCYLLKFEAHSRTMQISSARGVTPECVLTFMEQYEDHSASNYVQVRTFIRRFLVAMDNPVMLKMKTKVRGRTRTRVDWLTPEETNQIFQSPMSQQQSVLIGAGLLQGMRRVETLRLSVRDAKNALRFGILRLKGKDWKEREIPLHPEFATILKNYLQWVGQVDESAALLGFERTTSERLLADFCRQFGRKFSFHTMRRTFGRNLWLLGVPIETISEIFGHNSTDMTRRYLGLNLTDMRQALSRYTVTRECTIPKTLD